MGLRAKVALAAFLVAWAGAVPARAQEAPLPTLQLGIGTQGSPGELAASLQIVLLLTVLSLAPALLIMMTSFTRIIVVLSFLRSALAAGQMPPNQVLIGIALFLTFFTMAPVFGEVYEEGWVPFREGEIGQEELWQRAEEPLRRFMLDQTREADLALFVSLSGADRPASREEVGLVAVIPAFLISELKTAFQIGFLLFIPFIVIDMVVASTLMSMGMVMLPPMMISLPFKLLLFVMVDGWQLLARSLVESFR